MAFTAALMKTGTATPSLQLGGSSTGILYTGTRETVWRLIDDKLVWFRTNLALTSKGANPGSLTILSGIPTALAADISQPVTIIPNAFDSSVGGADQYAYITATTTIITFNKLVSGSRVAIAGADLTNGSSFIISGVYKIA